MSFSSENSPQIMGHIKSSLRFTPFETLWIPNSAKLVVLGENPRRTGNISIYDLQFDEHSSKLELQSATNKASGIKTGSFGLSSDTEARLTTGDFNGDLTIWDLDHIHKPVWQVKNAHSADINSVSCIGGGGFGSGAPEICTGGKDGSVKIWDPRTNKAVAHMKASANSTESARISFDDGRDDAKTNSNNSNSNSNNNQSNINTKSRLNVNNIRSRDCWCVSFGNSFNCNNRMIVAGYDNGDVKILDLMSNRLYFETNVRNGVCCVEFDRSDIKMNKLIVSTLESTFIVYDLKTRHCASDFAYSIQKSKSDESTIWQCRHLPQNRDIWCTCAGNGSVNLWKYVYPSERSVEDEHGHKKGVMGEIKLLAKQALCTQPIISWDWNKHKIGLAAMVALDQSVQVIIATKLHTI